MGDLQFAKRFDKMKSISSQCKGNVRFYQLISTLKGSRFSNRVFHLYHIPGTYKVLNLKGIAIIGYWKLLYITKARFAIEQLSGIAMP